VRPQQSPCFVHFSEIGLTGLSTTESRCVLGSGVPPNALAVAARRVPVDEPLGVLSEIIHGLGPAFRCLKAKRVIVFMHIRRDEFAFVGCAGCKDMLAQQIFVFS
jgi:hypothetical protein